jgi:hypothetical protein
VLGGASHAGFGGERDMRAESGSRSREELISSQYGTRPGASANQRRQARSPPQADRSAGVRRVTPTLPPPKNGC